MVDTVQLVLFFVIVVLTVLLVVLGIQVFYILKEVRRTIIKTNKVLDDTGTITESISKPVSSLSSVTMGLKASSILTVAKLVKGLLSRDDDDRKHSRE